MMWGYGPDWAWMMLIMPIFWIGLLALIAWAVVRVVQRHGQEQDRQRGESPQEILDKRFARGEIDADAYHEARAHLAGRPGPP
jgi:putative membrane protein